jgi:hypothetical protein
MPESIEETVVETTSRNLSINLDSPAGIVVTAFALYGVKAAAFDARRTVKKIVNKRKAKKADSETTEPRSSEK